jgi:low affinity Fe/Cu permease
MNASPNFMLIILVGLVVVALVGAIVHFTSKD